MNADEICSGEKIVHAHELNPLLCRDFLRTHPPTRDAYAEIKRQLVRYFPDDVDAYYDIKDPAFDLFMTAAREWAEWSRWAPSASDG